MKNTASLLVALIMLVSLGCSQSGSGDRPPTQRVTGTVTMGGTPVDGATVTFVPSDPSGKAASGLTDASGRYSLTTFESDDGAMTGSYKVMVSKYEAAAPGADADMGDDYVPPEAQGGVEPTGPKNLLPAKYASPETSGLTATVAEGGSTIDLALEEENAAPTGAEAAPQ